MARQPLETYYPHFQSGDLVRESDLVSSDEDGLGVVRIVRGTYDFAVQGGAISNIDLLDEDGAAIVIPANAIILDGMVDVQTTFITAGGDAGTISLGVQVAGDIVAAIAVNNVGDPWDQGLQEIIPVGTAATAVKTTAAGIGVLRAVVGGQVVTAGKLTCSLRYVVSDVNV